MSSASAPCVIKDSLLGLRSPQKRSLRRYQSRYRREKHQHLKALMDPGRWCATLCKEIKLKALKSCLVCLTSYCEAHLEPHQRVPPLMRHRLFDPVENLEERICEKHERLLELFCRDEQVCICLLCSETDHKYHDLISVEQEGAQQRVRIIFM